MACYHFTIKPDKKPDGTQIKAIEHIAYIDREGKYTDIDQSQELQNFRGNFLGLSPLANLPSDEKYSVYKSPFGGIRAHGSKFETSINASLETISITLAASVKKYGNEINVEGSNDFKAKVIFVAAEMEIPIKFTNPEMEKQKIRLIKQKEEAANGRRHGEHSNPITRNAKLSKPNLERIGSKPPPQRRGRLYELSSCPMVQYAEGNNVLLPGDASGKLDDQQTDTHQTMRWCIPVSRRVAIEKTADKILKIENMREQLLASSHIDYINRDENFAKRGGCIYKNHHLPKWAEDSPKKFFEAADKHEGIGYSRYKEIEFALPNELELEQQKEIIDKFLDNHLKDFYYAYAIHDKIGVMSNGQHNTHVHIMFSERRLDEREKESERGEKEFFSRPSTAKGKKIGGCLKDGKWNGKDRAKYLCLMRKDFAMIQNEILAKYGFNVRVDHRSLKAQREEALANGDLKLADLLNRMPEEHIGPNFATRKDHAKVANLLKYRQEKYEHQQLLYAAEMLEENIAKNEATAHTIKNMTDAKSVLTCSDKSRIHALKTDLLNALKEANALNSVVIWNDTAASMAREQFMTLDEREIHRQLQQLEKRRSSLEKFDTSLKKPPSWNQESLKIYEELKTELLQTRKKISKEIATLANKMKTISDRLAAPALKDKIQRETLCILKNNYHTKAMLKAANTKLTDAVLTLQQEVADVTKTMSDPTIKNSDAYTAKDIGVILQASKNNLQKEFDTRKKALEKLNNKVISLPRAKEMALDVFTKHAFKEIRERRRELKKEESRIEAAKQELETAKASFAQLTKPKWYHSRTEKDSYQSKEDHIHDLSATITQREDALSAKMKALGIEAAKLEARCAEPDAVAKITEITLGILQKNKPISDRYQELSIQQKATKEMLSETIGLEKGVKLQIAHDAKNGQVKYQVMRYAPVSSRSGNSPLTIAKAMNGNSKMAQVVAYSRKDEAERQFENSAKSRVDREVEVDITE